MGGSGDNCSLLILLMVAASCVVNARVTTKFGDIRGVWSRSSRGRLVTHYLGIPYARPPLGHLRFRVRCLLYHFRSLAFRGRGREFFFFGKIFFQIIVFFFIFYVSPWQSPQPWDETWNGTFEATKNAPPCYQMLKNGSMMGEEDCLYLNVYVPKVSGEREVRR